MATWTVEPHAGAFIIVETRRDGERCYFVRAARYAIYTNAASMPNGKDRAKHYSTAAAARRAASRYYGTPQKS